MKLTDKRMEAAGKLEDMSEKKGQFLNRKQRRFLKAAQRLAEKDE